LSTGLYEIYIVNRLQFRFNAKLMFRTLAIASLLAVIDSSPLRAEHVQLCEGTPYSMADGQNIVCSATWAFLGKCSGRDMWNDWKIIGRVEEPDAFIRPWLDVPILVIGYELVKLPRASMIWPWEAALDHFASWFMVGSTIVPDGMIWLGPGESHSKQMWPLNSGQPWPRASDARPIKPIRDASGIVYAAQGDLIDLHGICYGGAVRVLLTIYYTPQSTPGVID
jgi:hypothetical protein